MIVKGSVALVTGGASGLGRATVERIIRQGGRAVICDLLQSDGKRLAESLPNEYALFIPTDASFH